MATFVGYSLKKVPNFQLKMLEKGEQKQIKPQHKRKEKININIKLDKLKNNNNNNTNEIHSWFFRKKNSMELIKL